MKFFPFDLVMFYRPDLDFLLNRDYICLTKLGLDYITIQNLSHFEKMRLIIEFIKEKQREKEETEKVLSSYRNF